MAMSRLFKLSRFSRQDIKPSLQFMRHLSSDQSDDSKTEEKKKSEAALNKLKNLLVKMVEEDKILSDSKDADMVTKKLQLAKPKDKRGRTKSAKVKSPEEQLKTAVKNVARDLGGDVKKTESELLLKLLRPKTEGGGSSNLGDVVKGLKVERDVDLEQSRAAQVRNQMTGWKREPRLASRFIQRDRDTNVEERVDLFGGEPLNIFTPNDPESSEGVENRTWNKLYERELKLAVTHPPRNYFQQMILWTEQGKIWKFPIDNEQGLEEEQKVYFADHVFLEEHLEPWCPRAGPLRHFMELVCVGLSKNPYLTVEAKKEHIQWYRNYFDEKRQLLKEVGAIVDTPNVETPQIDK